MVSLATFSGNRPRDSPKRSDDVQLPYEVTLIYESAISAKNLDAALSGLSTGARQRVQRLSLSPLDHKYVVIAVIVGKPCDHVLRIHKPRVKRP